MLKTMAAATPQSLSNSKLETKNSKLIPFWAFGVDLGVEFGQDIPHCHKASGFFGREIVFLGDIRQEKALLFLVQIVILQ